MVGLGFVDVASWPLTLANEGSKGELDIWHCERVVNAEGYNIIFGYDRKADERRVHQYGLMKGTESNLERIVL